MGLSFIIATGLDSAVILGSESRGTHDHIWLAQIRLSQPGEPGPRIYILQEQGVPVIPLDNGFPFRCLIRLTGLRWRYLNWPPYGWLTMTRLVTSSYILPTNRTEKCHNIIASSKHRSLKSCDLILYLFSSPSWLLHVACPTLLDLFAFLRRRPTCKWKSIMGWRQSGRTEFMENAEGKLRKG
jgi:hypothetical protein